MTEPFLLGQRVVCINNLDGDDDPIFRLELGKIYTIDAIAQPKHKFSQRGRLYERHLDDGRTPRVWLRELDASDTFGLSANRFIPLPKIRIHDRWYRNGIRQWLYLYPMDWRSWRLASGWRFYRWALFRTILSLTGGLGENLMAIAVAYALVALILNTASLSAFFGMSEDRMSLCLLMLSAVAGYLISISITNKARRC